MRVLTKTRWSAVLIALVCLGGLFVDSGDTSAARIPRARVLWTGADPLPTCSEYPAGSTPSVLCFELAPGEQVTHQVTFETTQPVTRPRLVRQTANGATIIAVDSPTMPDPLPPHTEFTATLTISVPAGTRQKRASGRIYLADRGGVLVQPLNLRVEILHPLPEDVARTPIVVPANHIQLTRRPATMPLAGPNSGKFNLRDLTVSSGTTVTWTNRDFVNRAVKGTLCDPARPISRNTPCAPDPDALAEGCAGLAVPASTKEEVYGGDGRLLCFVSPVLAPENFVSVRLQRPDRRVTMTYFMEDANPPATRDTMAEVVVVGGRDTRFYPYVTVK